MSMFPTHDPATGLRVLVKQPSESREYRINFADLMDEAALSTVLSVTAEKQNLVGSSVALDVSEQGIDGSSAKFRLQGGTHNENYKITARVRDADTNELEGEGMLYVRSL